MKLARILTASLSLLAAACGARSIDPGADGVPAAPAPVVVDLFAPDGAGCVSDLPNDTATDLMAPGEGESIAVVDLIYTEECTGAGGQYVLGREIDGYRYFWVGGHACYFFAHALPVSLVYGVVRYRFTAAISEIPAGMCVAWPGEPDGVQTDVSTSAIAVFERLDEAKTFAASL
ncbi:Hypothetical protein A7982_06052 [Minicystis rosea]|nr:Hypothetical protein A7982_06052 [Minicystis rosea]